MGTGLGPECYAIIEQGRIGQILSSRPQDRRSVIEEAAGITKFKTRKRLAEAKLEGASKICPGSSTSWTRSPPGEFPKTAGLQGPPL